MSGFEARARKVLPPVLGHYTWLSIDRGEGSWLITTEGRRVLDMTCGIAVTAVGHAHPRVVKAVVDQAQRLMHISTGRSEERRVGKECRSRWSPGQQKKMREKRQECRYNDRQRGE